MVKNELRKVYKTKLRGVKCLTTENEEMKDDLLQCTKDYSIEQKSIISLKLKK